MKTEREVLEELLRQEFNVGGLKKTGRELAAQRLLKGALEGAVGLTKAFYDRIDATGAGRDDAPPSFNAFDHEILEDLHARLGPPEASTLLVQSDDEKG